MGIRIAELRTARGWSQKKLGEMVGATRDQIAGWEKGNLTFTQAIACAEVFGVSLDYLAGMSDVEEVDKSVSNVTYEYLSLDDDGRDEVRDFIKFKKSRS